MTLYMRRLSPLALSLVAVTAFGCSSKPSTEEVESETAITVKTVTAMTGDIRGVVHATGVVAPAPGAELVVVAPEAARVAEVPKATGDPVRQGDVLVRFDIPNTAAEVKRQRAEVSRGQAAVENARAAQTRARDLFDRGVAARKEIEDANRAMADAEAGLEQARAGLTAAETVADRSVVRAPFNGLVIKRSHNPGDLVEAAASDPILRVIDPRRLEVEVAVPLADALRIVAGATAHLAASPLATGDPVLKVLSGAGAVEPGTATVPVRLAFAAPTNIPTGTPVQVDIEADHHTGVVVVPVVAVVRDGEETAVFVVTGDKAKRQPVQLGLNDGTNVEIVSGVKSGDKVIVEGQAGLPDDAPVIEGDAENPAAAKPPAAEGERGK